MRLACHVLIASSAFFATAAASEFSFSIKDAKNEKIADAVVSLIPTNATQPLPSPHHGELAQRDQEYSSLVTVVQVGAKVLFPNRDTVQHHVYSLSKAKKFELPLYNPGSAKSFDFDVPGVVTLGCNIHDWMLAYIVVVPTPYFAKSDDSGAGQISAPAGNYRLELWHSRLASVLTQEIALTESASRQEFIVTLKPDRRIRRGPESKSGGYR